MKTNIKWIILSFMLLAFSGSVYAQGGFIGLGAYGGSGDDPFDNAEVGYGLTGGYMFNPNFGIEGGYYDLGGISAEGGGSDLETSAWGLALLLVAPTKAVKFYGRLGIAKVTAEIKAGGTVISDSDSSDVYYGIGIEFGPKNVGIFLEANIFPNDVSDVTTYGGGVRIWFNKK